MFLDVLARRCQIHGEKRAIALIDGENRESVSYAQLEERVHRTEAYLHALGVEPGDRVAAQLSKSLAFVYLHLAVMRMGAIFLPLNPAHPPAETVYFLADSGAKLLFTDANKRKDIESIAPTLPTLERSIFIDDDENFLGLLAGFSARSCYPLPADAGQTAMMLYTSGTTSRPKGARITHGNLSANIAALHEAWGWRDDDVLLHALPIFHVHGLVVALHGALHAGAAAAMTRTFDAEVTLELLASGRFSVFMGVPTMHRRLYRAADGRRIDLSGMRLLTSGSDRLPDDLFYGCQRVFNVTLLERYGMTETGMNLSNPLRGERRVGSVGMPLPGVEARIVDGASGAVLADDAVGELQIRGEHVFAGYWGQPKKTAQAFADDGWLRTGDLASRSADGYYTLKGRAKDLIISGGLNVYPPEVELALLEHEAVAACAVIGCPDEEWGERVVAVIVPRAGKRADCADIVDFCRGRLAAYKAPREVIVRESLPQNALGKVQKAALRDECRPS